MCTREEITEKYLFLALEELSKHRGSIKKGRRLERSWRSDVVALQFNEEVAKAVEVRKNAERKIIKL